MNKKLSVLILVMLVTPVFSTQFVALAEQRFEVNKQLVYPGLEWELEDGTFEFEHWTEINFQFKSDGSISYYDPEGNILKLPMPTAYGGPLKATLEEVGDHVIMTYTRGTKVEVVYDFDFGIEDEHGFVSYAKLLIEYVKWDLPPQYGLEQKLENINGRNMRVSKYENKEQAHFNGKNSRLMIGDDTLLGEVAVGVGFDWEDAMEYISYDEVEGRFIIEAYEGLVIDPVTVGTTTSSLTFTYNFQRRSFYVDSLHWLFYTDGTDTGYRTSSDGGSTWSSFTTLFIGTAVGSYSSFWFDGTNVHYTRLVSTGVLAYRRGIPVGDGSITWAAAEQTALSVEESVVGPTISVVNGYAGIGYRLGFPPRANVTFTSTTDGTWSVKSGFPYGLDTGNSTHVILVPLSTNDVYAVWAQGWADIPDGVLKGAVYDWSLSQWNATEDITSAGDGLHVFSGFTAVADTDEVHIAYLQNSSLNLVHNYRDSAGAWQGEATIAASVSSTTYPILARDNTGDKVVCFYMESDDLIYKEWDGSWGGAIILWESVDGLTHNYAFTTYYADSGNKIGVTFLEGDSSPYSVEYVFITTEAGQDTDPTDLKTEGSTNPTSVSDTTPEFSAIVHGMSADQYYIKVGSFQGGSDKWDSGWSALDDTYTDGERVGDITYDGSAISLNGDKFYWTIAFRDSVTTTESEFDTEGAHFTMSEGTAAFTLDISFSADSFFTNYNGDQGDNNWGTQTKVHAGGRRPREVVYPYWNIIKVDLSALPGDAEITNARLYQYVYDNELTVQLLSLHRVDDNSWTETGVTWNNKPEDLATLDTYYSSSGYDRFQSTALTTNVINAFNDDKIVSFIVKGDSETQLVWMYSREYGDSDFTPFLRVSYNSEGIGKTTDGLKVNRVDATTNPTINDITPDFRATVNGMSATHVEVEVGTSTGDNDMWDSSLLPISDINTGEESDDVRYSGSTLSRDGTTYWFRMRFYDDILSTYTDWSTENATFTMEEVTFDYLYSTRMYFDSADYNEDFTNIPIPFIVTSDDINFTNVQDDLDDFTFFDSDGTSELSHYIVSHDVNTRVEGYVKVPQINKLSTTDFIILKYGGSQVGAPATRSETATYASTDIEAHWGMEDASGNMLDSTTNNMDGTAAGNPTYEQPGVLGYSIDLDGDGDMFDFGEVFAFDDNDAFSFSFWAYVDVIESARVISNDQAYMYGPWSGSWINRVWNEGVGWQAHSAPAVQQDKWTYVTNVYDGSALYIYNNGTVAAAGIVKTYNADHPVDDFFIGGFSGGQEFNGRIDSIRVSAVNRSDYWHKAMYRAYIGDYITFGEAVEGEDPTYIIEIGQTNTEPDISSDLYSYWKTDTEYIDFYRVEHNNTGSMVNQSYTDFGVGLNLTEGWANITITVNAAETGNDVWWRSSVNNSLGEWTWSDWQVFTIEEVLPSFSGHNNNDTEAGWIAEFNVTIDMTGSQNNIDGYIFGFDNGVGSFTNDTWVNITDTKSYVASVTKILTSSVGADVNWIWYANSTSGNWNVSAEQDLTTVVSEFHPSSDKRIGWWWSVDLNSTYTQALDGVLLHSNPAVSPYGQDSDWEGELDDAYDKGYDAMYVEVEGEVYIGSVTMAWLGPWAAAHPDFDIYVWSRSAKFPAFDEVTQGNIFWIPEKYLSIYYESVSYAQAYSEIESDVAIWRAADLRLNQTMIAWGTHRFVGGGAAPRGLAEGSIDNMIRAWIDLVPETPGVFWFTWWRNQVTWENRVEIVGSSYERLRGETLLLPRIIHMSEDITLTGRVMGDGNTYYDFYSNLEGVTASTTSDSGGFISIDFGHNETVLPRTVTVYIYSDYDISTDSMHITGTSTIESYDEQDEFGFVRVSMIHTADCTLSIGNPTIDAPYGLETEGRTNPTEVVDLTPEFSAVPQSITATHIEYEVGTVQNGNDMWDSDWLDIADTAAGVRTPTSSYDGTALTLSGTTYWVRTRIKNENYSSQWTDGADYFVMATANTRPGDIQIEKLTNPTGVTNLTPNFTAVVNGVDATEYQIQVGTTLGGNDMWDSAWESFSSSQADTTTCENITYAGLSIFLDGSKYFVRMRFKSPTVTGDWSNEVAHFTMSSADTFEFRDEDNDNVFINQDCTFTIEIESHNSELSTGILSHNVSGAWANESSVALNGYVDIAQTTVNLTGVADKVLHYIWYVTSRAGAEGRSDTYTFTMRAPSDTIFYVSNLNADKYAFVGDPYNFVVESSWGEELGFRFDDDFITIEVLYDNSTTTLSVESGDYLFTVSAYAYTNNSGTYQLNVTMMFNDFVIDDSDIDVYTWASDGSSDTGWVITEPSYFDILNIGGEINYVFSGWAGRYVGGEWIEIYAADTRTSEVLPLETFDFRSSPLAINEDEDELMAEMEASWFLMYPYKTELANMHPTNRLDSYTDVTARAFNSFPFSFTIYDNAVDHNRQLYIERNFRRNMDDTSTEILSVQAFMMNPDVDVYSGQFRVQEQSIFETGFSYIASQIRFDAQGELEYYHRSNGWTTLLAVGDYIWYNVTLEFDLDVRTYNIWVGTNIPGSSVKRASDIPYVDTQCDRVNTVFFGTINHVTTSSKFYIDDVKAWTDWDADYGGQALASTVQKGFQQISMKFGFGIEEGPGTTAQFMSEGYIEFGEDILIKGSDVWLEEYRMRITPVEVDVRAVMGKHNWALFKVEHFHLNVLTSTDFIYALYESDPNLESTIQREQFTFNYDFWHNLMDGSTWIGGRLSAVYFGMSDKSPWWTFGFSSDWNPKSTDETSSDFYDRLKDGSGNVISPKEIELFRLWAKVRRTNVSTFHYDIRNVRELDIVTLHAQEAYIGVNTPPVVETVTANLVQTGVNGLMASLRMSLTKLITGLASAGVRTSIALIDIILGIFRVPPGTFSNLLNTVLMWISEAPQWLTWFVSQVANMIAFIGSIIGPTLQLITDVMEAVVWLGQNMGAFIVFPFSFLRAFFQGSILVIPFTDGAITADFTEAGSIMSNLMVAMPVFIYIAWLRWSISDGIFGLPGKIQSMFSFTYSFFISMFAIFFFMKDRIFDVYYFARGAVG